MKKPVIGFTLGLALILQGCTINYPHCKKAGEVPMDASTTNLWKSVLIDRPISGPEYDPVVKPVTTPKLRDGESYAPGYPGSKLDCSSFAKYEDRDYCNSDEYDLQVIKILEALSADPETSEEYLEKANRQITVLRARIQSRH